MSTKVITGKVRASYAWIYESHSMGGSEPKYSICLIIPKEDTVTIGKIQSAVAAETENGRAKWGGKIPANLKLPLRDGDAADVTDPAYKGCYFINCSNPEKPGVVDRHGHKCETPGLVYSGCYIRASINIYAYNAPGNRGVSASINNIQFWEDGEPLNGRVRAEDEFDSLDDEEDDFLA